MRFLKTFMCFLFMLAVSVAPAAALPMCQKMTKQAAISYTGSSDDGNMPHCSGSKGDTSTQSLPPSTDNPPVKDGCCCDGDMGSACKTNCKTVTSAATLAGATNNLYFQQAYSTGLETGYVAFIQKIITPPPRSCT